MGSLATEMVKGTIAPILFVLMCVLMHLNELFCEFTNNCEHLFDCKILCSSYFAFTSLNYRTEHYRLIENYLP